MYKDRKEKADKNFKNDLPKLAKPAERALYNAGLTSLKQITSFGENELLALHGIGKNAVETLRKSLAEQGLAFKKQ
jgi:hypothetical protein